LLGRVISDSKTELNLGSNFFQGKEVDKDVFLGLVKKAHILNAVGEKTIGVLIDKNLINKEDTLSVNKVPHIQVIYEG
jgi:hypothetical protein